jgi:hypothetical protein
MRGGRGRQRPGAPACSREMLSESASAERSRGGAENLSPGRGVLYRLLSILNARCDSGPPRWSRSGLTLTATSVPPLGITRRSGERRSAARLAVLGARFRSRGCTRLCAASCLRLHGYSSAWAG